MVQPYLGFRHRHIIYFGSLNIANRAVLQVCTPEHYIVGREYRTRVILPTPRAVSSGDSCHTSTEERRSYFILMSTDSFSITHLHLAVLESKCLSFVNIRTPRLSLLLAITLHRNWTVLVSTTGGSESATVNWQDRYDRYHSLITEY